MIQITGNDTLKNIKIKRNTLTFVYIFEREDQLMGK
jgi:hypothetical protein